MCAPFFLLTSSVIRYLGYLRRIDLRMDNLTSLSYHSNDSLSVNLDYWTKNKKLIKKLLWWYVLCASLVGILFNFVCIRKLARLKERQNHRALFSISLANLTTLILILVPHLAVLIDNHQEVLYTAVYCKVYTFLLHSLSSFATWCWLLLALLRYIAVLHPYTHFKFRDYNLWRFIIFLLVFCCCFEFWTLIIITRNANHPMCDIDGELITPERFETLNITEVLLSYFLPFLLIFSIDVSVFCRIYLCSDKTGLHRIVHTGVTQSDSYGHGMAMIVPKSYAKRFTRRRHRTFLRLILLTTLNLGLNLPNCIVRLLDTFDATGSWLPEPYNDIVQKLTFALSYTHYALSYVYCQVLINSAKHHHNSSFRVTKSRRCLASSLVNLTDNVR